MHGSTKATFKESYQSLADKLTLPRRHDPKINVLALVRDWLQRDDVAPWLIILDNADNFGALFDQAEESPIASYLPKTSNGKVIVISRNLNIAERLIGSQRAIMQVPIMGSAEALLLLQKKLISGFDESAAADLIYCLDYIPLAVNQAAAYINRRSISICAYIKRFQDSDRQKSSLLRHDGGDIRRHENMSNSIAVTWQVTFDQILLENPAAANLLSLLSCFQPQNIPQHMLSRYNEGLVSEFGNNACDVLVDDIDCLFAYSLISKSAEPHVYEMHSLVQVYTRAWRSELGHITRWDKLFLQLASEQFPSGYFETWRECQLLLPHVERILERQPGDEADILIWGLLLKNASCYMVERGDYKKAAVLAKKSVDVRKELLGLDHLDTLTSMANLASTFWNQGRLEEAERLQVKVMEARKAKLGADHQFTLTSMHNLAYTLNSLSRRDEALGLMDSCASLRRHVLGLQHPHAKSSIEAMEAWQKDSR